MKEAAGEANMTVITIVLIAIVLAIGTVLVRNMMNRTGDSSTCTSNGNIWYNGRCFTPDRCNNNANGVTTCQ